MAEIVLVINNTYDSRSERMTFTDQMIPIGRVDEENKIVLPDPNKMVSKKHAFIEQRDGRFSLIDQQSLNGTKLNGMPLEKNTATPLNNGDKIEIGHYILTVEQIVERAAGRGDETMIFNNPFFTELSELAELLRRVAYKLSEQPQAERHWQYSLQNLFNELQSSGSGHVLAALRGGAPGDVSPAVQRRSTTDVFMPPDHTSLLASETVVKLINGMRKFRLEFLGETEMQLDIINWGKIKTYDDLNKTLYNPDLPEEDHQKRVALFIEEAEKLYYHQIGLIEGYVGAIQDGAGELLKMLDPLRLEQEFYSSGSRQPVTRVPSFLLPLFIHWKIYKFFKQKYKELRNEDPALVEKKYFRSAFVRYYNQRIKQFGKKQKLADDF